MANYYRRKIKNIDLFGHPVSFNLNEKGDTFTTLPGGLCSILFYVLVLVFSVVTLVLNVRLVKDGGAPILRSYNEMSLEKPSKSVVESYRSFYMF